MKFLEGEDPAFGAIKKADWARTPLGAPERWPTVLTLALHSILRSEAPRALLWGPELLTFCNNASIEQGCVDSASVARSYPEAEPQRWSALEHPVRTALSGHGNVLPEFEHPGAQGDENITYQLNFSPVFDDDLTVAGVLVDIVDLTARKRQEESLRGELALLNALFSSAPVLIAYCSGPDLIIDYMNPAFQRLFSGRALVGRKVSDAVPEAVERGYVERIKAVFATGIAWEERELPLSIRSSADAKDELHYFDFACHPIAASGGAISGLVFSGYEVTDRRAARKESERLRNQLLHASRTEAMGTMAATIAHELNQPLAAATNYIAAAEGLLSANETGEAAGASQPLTEAQRQLIRAGTIIRRMRSLVERGSASATAFDVSRSIARATDLLRAGGELEGFSVEVEIAPGGEHAIGDDIQIEQVFANILRNAADASERSASRRIKVCVRRQDSMIEVLIRDWGPGIAPQLLESLFTAMPKSSAGGLGVGLSLCRTIIEAHGGIISAGNDEVGAVFRFTLPAPKEPFRPRKEARLGSHALRRRRQKSDEAV